MQDALLKITSKAKENTGECKGEFEGTELIFERVSDGKEVTVSTGGSCRDAVHVT
jgi:hypothetical protein